MRLSFLLIEFLLLAAAVAPLARAKSKESNFSNQSITLQSAFKMDHENKFPKVLTLKEAERYALAHHPAIKTASYQAKAATEVVKETLANFFPQLAGSAVFAEADGGNSRMAATSDSLSNPTILSRESNGLYLSQLITDFGKTAFLTSSSRFNARSMREQLQVVQEMVLLNVDRTYYAVLRANELVRLTEQETKTNELLKDRVKALADSNLKSSLDVSIQEATLAQTRLLMIDAAGHLKETLADLMAAMGSRDEPDFKLAEDFTIQPLTESSQSFEAKAFSQRPDLIAMRFERDAALKYAAAQGAARLPTVSAIAAGGGSPYHEGNLSETYGMIGVNVSIPLFTGGRLTAQQKEAQLKAKAVEQQLEDRETLALRDVRTAWINAQTAFKKIQVSKEYLDAASKAFDLAQSLYVAGTSSIVELSQADLQRIQAQIALINARYEFLTKLSILAYQIGDLK